MRLSDEPDFRAITDALYTRFLVGLNEAAMDVLPQDQVAGAARHPTRDAARLTFTARARPSSTPTVSSQLMQASVMLRPNSSFAGSLQKFGQTSSQP